MLVVRVQGVWLRLAAVMVAQQAAVTLSRLWRLPGLMMVVAVVSGLRYGIADLLECGWGCCGVCVGGAGVEGGGFRGCLGWCGRQLCIEGGGAGSGGGCACVVGGGDGGDGAAGRGCVGGGGWKSGIVRGGGGSVGRPRVRLMLTTVPSSGRTWCSGRRGKLCPAVGMTVL